MAAVKKVTPKAVKAKGVTKAQSESSRSRHSYTGPKEPHLSDDVTAAVVDAPPPATRSAMTYAYAHKMAEVREQVGVGVWVMLAEFVSRSGASRVRVELERGTRPVDGEVGDWEFASRRVTGVAGVGSRLYAKLLRDE